MADSLERWLNRRWYEGVPPESGLRWLARGYQIWLASRRPPVVEKMPVPVLVVGNFTAGGTGKTPLTIALAKYFAGKGRRPAIVSRGYGRQSSKPVRVSAQTPATQCGDEPRLIFEKTGLPVLVDSDRVAAARAALETGCDLIIADDGLQHSRLGRAVEIEVVDGQRRYGNGLLLPAGPLRELPRECDFRVVNGYNANAGEWTMHMRLGEAVRVDNPGTSRPLSKFNSAPVHCFAATGNPRRFFDSLRRAGLDPIEHGFDDHHRFRPEDFAGVVGPILMTEKDAVKCRGLILNMAWAVPAEAQLAPEFFLAVENKLAAHHGSS